MKAIEKQEGVWNVAGITVDFDLQAKLAKVYNAADQVKLLAAIKELGLTDVVDANIASYSTALTKVKETTSVTEFTKVVAQKVITDGNKAATESTDATAAVKAVNDAKDQVALLAALQNSNFKRVNPEWISEYQTKLAGISVATNKDEVKEIQAAVIDAANDDKIGTNASPVVLTTGVDVAKLTEAKNLVTTYATPDSAGAQTSDTKAILKKINIQLALADLLAATTPTSFKSKFDALVKVVDNAGDLAATDYVVANGQAYIDALAKETTVANKDQVSEVKDILFKASTGVNDKQALKLVDAVYTASGAASVDADALLKTLKDLGLENVADSNKEQYKADAAAFNTASTTTTNGGSKTKADVQTQVNTSNIAAVASAFTAQDADKLLEALKVLKVKNIVDANKGEYLKDAASTIKTDADTMSAAVKAINDSLTNTNEVNAINAATTATEVKTALDNLGIAEYVNAPSGDKLYLAEKVLEKRNALTAGRDALKADGTASGNTTTEAKKFVNKNEVAGEIAKASTGIKAEYTALVGKFAQSALTDTATTVANLTELEYANFNTLTSGQKAELAEYLVKNYPHTIKPSDGTKVYSDYASLAEVKAAVDAAITALGF